MSSSSVLWATVTALYYVIALCLTQAQKHLPYKYYDPSKHEGDKSPGLLHIPKASGSSLRAVLIKKGGFKITDDELCLHKLQAIYGKEAFFFTTLRSPREHVYSQFIMSKYGIPEVNKTIDFPKYLPDSDGFSVWVEHFYSRWNKRTDENIEMAHYSFESYNPYNMQSRAMSDNCERPHDYPKQSRQSDSQMESAIRNMDTIMSFVGITELFDLSICLLWDLFGKKYESLMKEACAVNTTMGKDHFRGHRIPAHSIHDVKDEKVWMKVDEMTRFDNKLWKRALVRLLDNAKQFEIDRNISVMHLYRPSMDMVMGLADWGYTRR